MKRRVLACFVLTAALTGAASVGAFAAEDEGGYIDPSWWRGEAVQAQTDELRFVSRAEMVNEFYLVAGSPEASVVGENAVGFEDVPGGHAYAKAIEWASATGLISGYGNGNFGPDDFATREQAAVVAVRYIEQAKVNIPATMMIPIAYEDEDSISSWARQSAGTMQNYRFLGAAERTVFQPKEKLAKSDLAYMIETIMNAPGEGDSTK